MLLSEEKKQREEVPTSTDVSNAYGVIWHYDENRLERVGLCGGWGLVTKTRRTGSRARPAEPMNSNTTP